MKLLELKGIGEAICFSNGVCVVNTTPHPITMQDVTGEIVTVPTTVLINAETSEKAVDDLLVTSVFSGTPEGNETIRNIENSYAEKKCKDRLVIIGSIIAAQAYKGKVAGMCPVSGFERVAPSEKRMRCDRFIIFNE